MGLVFEDSHWGGDHNDGCQGEPYVRYKGSIKQNVYCKKCSKVFGLEWRPTKYSKWWLWDREVGKWHDCKEK